MYKVIISIICNEMDSVDGPKNYQINVKEDSLDKNNIDQ
jgi:hypothetical protein